VSVGVYGVGPASRQNGRLTAERAGCVIAPRAVLSGRAKLPGRVSTLDELLLLVPNDTPLKFDPELGFHLYGADLCLQAAEHGPAVAAAQAPCKSNTANCSLPPEFFRSADVFARKWQQRLPVATPCVIVDKMKRLWMF
jgi:hypothetical protein